MIAYYERNFAREWKLVAYANNPGKSVNGTVVERTNDFTVPDTCINEDGSVNMELLLRIFPPPTE